MPKMRFTAPHLARANGSGHRQSPKTPQHDFGAQKAMRFPRLIHGNCIDGLRRLPDELVDAVVTDPPYGIRYRSPSGARILNDNAAYIWWLHEAWRVTAKNGALVCFCRWDVQEDFRWAIELAGWKVKSQVIWDRMLHGMGDVRAAFAPRHDVIWFAVKGNYRFPNRRPVSVIQTQRMRSGLVHPTEKPVELMERLLEAVVRPAGVVLDPCMGSGSTGVACTNKGYRFIGMELDPNHFRTAKQRIALRTSSRRKS